MATYRFEINKVVTNGPFSYTIWKEQDAKTTVTGKADAGAALDGVKTDVLALLSSASESVNRITGTVTTL